MTNEQRLKKADISTRIVYWECSEGLILYTPNIHDSFGQKGLYMAKILHQKERTPDVCLNVGAKVRLAKHTFV